MELTILSQILQAAQKNATPPQTTYFFYVPPPPKPPFTHLTFTGSTNICGLF